MGNNANSIPAGGSTGVRGNIKGDNNESDCMPWGGAAHRADGGQNAAKFRKEADGRSERTVGSFRHTSGDQPDYSRHSSSVQERHAVWAPRPSPQNLVGGREALIYQPTIEIQPLTDELLMAELPKYNKKIADTIQFQTPQMSNDERADLPGLKKPYSRFKKKNEKKLVNEVCNKLSEIKDAIVSPQVHKKDLPGLENPLGDFAHEKKKMTELWPSLASTAHFEQYLPKENREPELIERVEKDLECEMVKVRAKRSKEVKKSEETYLVELKKDLLKLTTNIILSTDEQLKPETLNMDLIKIDLPMKDNEHEEEIDLMEEDVKFVVHDNLSTFEKAKCLNNISEKLPKESNVKGELDEIRTDLLTHLNSDRFARTQLQQSRMRKIEMTSVPEDISEETSEISNLDETMMDSFEDITMQEFSELDNSLDRIPDFPKDETEATYNTSANENTKESPALTGFESRPFDLTKIKNEPPSAPPFKPKFFKNATQSVPRNEIRDTKDLTLVEHGYAKRELKQVNSESPKKKSNDQLLGYEHSYAKNEGRNTTTKGQSFPTNWPHREGAEDRRKEEGNRSAKMEASNVRTDTLGPWASIAKFYERREEGPNQRNGDNPLEGDWVRLENLGKANKKQKFPGAKPSRPF